MICPCWEDLPEPVNDRKGWPWTQGSEEFSNSIPNGEPWPKLTIVTPSYNQGQFLEETIRSVLLQGYPDLEYIVIDGGSTDNSVEIIKKYENWLAHWESQPDQGQGHAINKGWKKAKPGIWAWLNSDDTYFPGTLAKAVSTFKSHPGIKMVYAAVSHTNENGQHLYYYYGQSLPRGLKRMAFWKGWNIPQPTVFFDSQLVEKYGGLDENFHLALDYDLFIRFSRDEKLKYIDDVWATTRLHPGAKTGDWKVNKIHFFKEMRVTNRKNTNLLAYLYLVLQEFLYNRKKKNTETDKKKIIFIREIFEWMGSHSAYDPLCHHMEKKQKYLSYNIYRKSGALSSSFLKASLYSYLHTRINPNPFYSINSLRAEVAAFRRFWKKKGDIIHVMYGENNYGILGRLKKITGIKLVVTFHQTPQWWEENYRKPGLIDLIDIIIVVSKSQVAYFETMAPGRVFFIPLGIDTDFFTPTADEACFNGEVSPRIVFSGFWMRDIRTLAAVVQKLLNHNTRIMFDFLVPESRRKEAHFSDLVDCPRVLWHAGISDQRLKEIYQNASLLFIPYINCTASCALLEAMACGLPIISSNVGGIPDYTDPSFAQLLPPGDVEGFTNAIINFLANLDQLKKRSHAARKFAVKNFTWSIIGDKTLRLYQQLLQ